MERGDIAHYSVMERLRDGRPVTIRSIRPDDKGRMADALREVSSESLYRRTFSAKKDLSDDDLKHLTEVDFEDVVALVAILKEEGQDRIVGGGRYVRPGASGATPAEVAFLVDDAHQGLGIGTRIFKHLVAIAHASGITQFEAEVLPSNEGMLRLFTRSGLPLSRTMTRDSVHVTIDLTAAEDGKLTADRQERPNTSTEHFRRDIVNLPLNKTKIVCTIGPASETPAVMRQMIEAGMNIARLNFSHGDFAAHKKVIENLRAASASLGRRIAIMADLSGPKMRIGKIDPEPIELKPGHPFTLTTEDIIGHATRVSVSFDRLSQAVKPGDTLFLNDGYIQLEVTGVKGRDVVCLVRVGGELRSRKGLNLPGIELGISAFTKRDHECLAFALENGVDAVSQSFVESAADIEAVRAAAVNLGHYPFIIAKIERSGALANIDSILDAADGIMIARGDLGVEVPIEEIAMVQKRLMRLANMLAKPVITATQMLESMTDNRRPTRAEVTDVANAILDGTDCVMLSGESAMGKYPVDAVAMLAKIAASVEARRPAIAVKELYQGVDLTGKVRPEHLIAIGVEACLEYESPAAVFVPTHGGDSARSIARFRFPAWTIAVSSQQATCQNLQFSSGVYPVHEPEHPERWTEYIRQWVGDRGMEGRVAVLTEGPSTKHPEMNHRMEIVRLT